MKLNFRKFTLAAGNKNGLGQRNAGEEPSYVIIIIVKVIRDEDIPQLELSVRWMRKGVDLREEQPWLIVLLSLIKV